MRLSNHCINSGALPADIYYKLAEMSEEIYILVQGDIHYTCAIRQSTAGTKYVNDDKTSP